VLFSGTYGENILMPLQGRPMGELLDTEVTRENASTGNSIDLPGGDWLDLASLECENIEQVRDWWVDLVRSMGSAEVLFARSLDLPFDAQPPEGFAAALVALRPRIAQELTKAELSDHIWRLEYNTFNPAFPVLDNLLFGAPLLPLTAQVLSEQTSFLSLLKELKLEATLINLSIDMVNMLRDIFGLDGTDHPLFLRLGLDARDYEQAVTLVSADRNLTALSAMEEAQLLIVPFSISAEVMGSSFPADVTDQVLAIRHSHGGALRESMKDIYAPIEANQPVVGLSVLENAVLGKVSQGAGRKGNAVRAVVGQVLRDEGLEALTLGLIFDTPVGLGGANLSAQMSETLALSRAAIKRPDVLVLDNVLSTLDPSARPQMYANLHALLPQTTLICLEPSFQTPDDFELHLEMTQGRMTGKDELAGAVQDETANVDLNEKIRVLKQSDMFSTLDRKQLRLLAFGARWHKAKAGEYLFYKDDDPSSGAYLIVAGEADLRLPNPDGEDTLVLTVGPGKLVGELGLIRNVPRALDMQANSDLTSLRIGAEEFLAVVENDATTAYKLLQVVAGYVGS
jgi:energy-coupling factor transporter ATP-binding protein EcfA2